MNRTPLYHFIGALVLLIVVVGLNVFWYNTVADESTQVSTLASEVKAKLNDSARAAEAKSELAMLASDQTAVEQYFVSTNDVVPFLTQLQTTGSYLGSTVQIASVSAMPGTPYGQLSLSLSIAGSFNSVMRTLGSIEYGPYDTSINTLSLDAPVATPASSGAKSTSSSDWIANAVFTIGTEVQAPISVPVGSSTPTTSSTSVAAPTP